MADFVHSAFPWVAYGIGLAFYLTHINLKNINQDIK